MIIVPKAAPAITPLPTATPSGRDRAVAQMEALLAAERAAQAPGREQAQETPVLDPTRISPEEASAIKTAESRQNDTTESVESETVKEETKAVEEEPISSQYAVLARKEKALRQRDQQLRAREAAIKTQEDASKAALAPPKPAFDESKYISKDRLLEDTFGALSELGLTYDQLTERALNAPKSEDLAITNELKALREELKAIKGETENTKKSIQDQQTQSYQQAVAQIRNEAKNLVDHNPDFETIKETSSIGDVVDLIEQTFKEDGILLTVEEAARQVEDYLVEEAMKITKIKKIQQRMQAAAPKPTPTAAVQESTSQPKQQQLKTLTNSVGTSRQLSARERALLAFENKLTK